MHYLDEGAGEPIVFLHGSATWSYLFRNLIKQLMGSYRCLAVDLPGFGLSDKGTTQHDSLSDQLEAFAAWVEGLSLDRFTLVAHDLGGPIGLHFLLRQPHRIDRLVLLNSWAWPIDKIPATQRYRRRWAGWWGPWLHRRTNVFPWNRLRTGWGSEPSSSDVMVPYLSPYLTETDRKALQRVAYSFWQEKDFFEHIWNRRELLADTPALLLMGKKDRLADPKAKERFQTIFPQARVHWHEQSGHYLPEEDPDWCVRFLRTFLSTVSHPSTER